MKTTVINVWSVSSIQVKDAWTFHGCTGKRIRLVGIRRPPEIDERAALAKMVELLLDHEVDIVEQWFVQGRTLHAVVELRSKPIWDHLPEFRTYLLEPSRKLSPFDQTALVRVTGGLPPGWENPLTHLDQPDATPYFGEVVYPTKFWLPDFPENLARAELLYCHERDESDDQERRIADFFKSPARNVLVIFGDCGIGKTWFVIHNVINHRPADSDYAYIDLRGRPKDGDLMMAIHRELGQFLDKHINESSDPIKALSHYLDPIVRPLFDKLLYDPNAFPEREKMREAYYKIASDPNRLIDYNDVRLGAYDNSRKKLLVIVDNVDNYSDDEQVVVLEFITRSLLGHDGIRVIVPVRPTSALLMGRLAQALDLIIIGVDLRSPNIEAFLKRRCSVSVSGKRLSLDARLPRSAWTWGKLLQAYVHSESASMLADLCSSESDLPPPSYRSRTAVIRRRYDCRHYIRLFRRLLLSDVIREYENITSEYYAVQALMLRPGEPMAPQSAFLFNLFDNDQPEIAGNALIRYRILEYFHTNSDVGALFDNYFRALGPGPRIARKVMESFILAGLLVADLEFDKYAQKEEMRSARITIAGRRHFAIVRNLWYGICAKTGMHVEPGMIKRGEEARRAAMEEVGIEGKVLLDFYASHGWVSDRDFIEFLFKQEDLESRRIGLFQEAEPSMLGPVSEWINDRSSPAEILGVVYGDQLDLWRRKGKHIL